MYQHFIGIDVSKHWFDAAIWVGTQAQVMGQFGNNKDGFNEFRHAVKRVAGAEQATWFVCLENTGSYSKPLLYWLLKEGIPCREENAMQISRSKGLTRGKDDLIDARSICTYAYRHKDTLKPTQLPSKSVLQIKKLLSRRALLVRQRASLRTSLKEQRSEFEEVLFQQLESQNEELILLYTTQIQDLEKLIDQIVQADAELESNCTLAKSVKGIGPVVAWHLIAYTNNFKAFDNSRQFACYCGIAPFPNRSGKSYSGKDRVHHFANKQIKALLTNSANAAIQTDPELKLYYQKKRSQGKEYGTAINAVKNKVIARVFAVIKRQSPYIPLMQYAS